MFKLRPYQVTALNSIHEALKTQKEVLLQAIMGAGKTVIITRLINRYFKETDRQFLILAHKQELVEQFEESFRTMSQIPFHEIGISCAGLKLKDFNKRVTIGTVQTFIGQLVAYKKTDLLVIDEAHRIEIGTGSQYDQIINSLRSHNPNMRIIGLTATPFRLGHGYIYGDKCAGTNLFPRLTHQISYEELKNQGYLMKLEGKVAVADQYQQDLSYVGTHGDYILNQLGEMMMKPIHLQTAVDAIHEHCQEFKCICVHCCTIDHAEKLKDLLGEECTTVHSKLTDIERYQNMKNWKGGEKRIITSVNILIEGFDHPPLDCLVGARPTQSTSLYLQSVGRVLRISSGKKRAFFLDLTDNTERFGTNLDHVRVRVPKAVEEKIKKEHPNEKQCPECEKRVHVARMICPECNYEWDMKEYEEALKPPETRDIVFNEPEEFEVAYIEIHRHKKEGSPDSVRVEYWDYGSFSRFPIASKWLAFDNPKAAYFVRKWWDENTVDCVLPGSTDEALKLLPECYRLPKKIWVKETNGFKEIIEYEYEEKTFNRLPALEDFEDDVPF
jgi:DNA repair protein RadD